MGGASGQGAGEEASRGEASTEEELTEAVGKQGLGTPAQIGLGDGGGTINVAFGATAKQRIRCVDRRVDAIRTRLDDAFRLLRPGDSQPS